VWWLGFEACVGWDVIVHYPYVCTEMRAAEECRLDEEQGEQDRTEERRGNWGRESLMREGFIQSSN